MIRLAFASASALAFVATAALAENCRPIESTHDILRRNGGEWAPVSSNEWQFLRGIYAMDPLTPPGLPFGAEAMLATSPQQKGGVIFFIDGDQACTPMPVPDALIKLLRDVAGGVIAHDGAAM